MLINTSGKSTPSFSESLSSVSSLVSNNLSYVSCVLLYLAPRSATAISSLTCTLSIIVRPIPNDSDKTLTRNCFSSSSCIFKVLSLASSSSSVVFFISFSHSSILVSASSRYCIFCSIYSIVRYISVLIASLACVFTLIVWLKLTSYLIVWSAGSEYLIDFSVTVS